MKKLFILNVLVLFIVSLAAQDIPPKPNPPRLVNDFGKMLTQAEVQQLERKLVAYNDTTSTQIAIVTVESLKGNDVIDYARKIGQGWGVGQRGKNNGVVILISKNDRESAIVTGYGVEGPITDILASQIQRNYMIPHFKNGNFYKGLDEATTAIIQAAAGEFKSENKPGRRKNSLSGLVVFLVILIFIIVPILSAMGRTRKNHIGRKGLNFWTILWLLSSMGGGRRGGGGFGGGGSWGGGGSGGGGFGGFGGGSFGGGGARGSW